MTKATLMIIGLGDLGGYVLEFLARVPNIPKIVTADINEDWGARKTNSAVVGASQFGLYPDIEFVQLDAFDLDKTAKILGEVQPTLIYNSMTLQSWWVITQLPKEAYKAIDEARYAPWYPMHFLPTYKLMLAVKKAGINTHVVNAAFPDVVNPALAAIGLSPTVGIGNIDNLVPSLRVVAARMLKAPLRSVTVYLVAPHFVSYYAGRFGNTGGAPYYLKVMVDDQDITPKINRDELISKVVTLGKRPGGLQAHPVVASSVCKIIQGIMFDTQELGHAPGPNGLPGGYPVRLSRQGVEVFLPGDLTLEEAIKINNEAQVFEGIESIGGDGTVVLTDKSSSIFKKLLDFDCKVYTVKESETKAKELDDKFKKWAAQFK
ncbi:MAG: hypothetical protein AB1641_18335 [Thermodesulfobacteriota bacterium]